MRARFIEESAQLGIQIRVISGEEEARLIFQAVSHAIPFPEEPVVLVDIGGGSTELTWILGERVPASLPCPGASSAWRTPCPRPIRPPPRT